MRTFTKERGFLTFAQNGSTDYVRLAYALALSLKASQTEVSSLSIVITPGTHILPKYEKIFDEIIEVPWIDEAWKSDWKLENEWKAYHVTPYRETIKLDADMLFPSDISSWWNVLGNHDFCAAATALTYRGEIATSNHYRKTFVSNDLPNVYSAFTYFKYSDLAQSVFEMMELIFHNWEHMSYEYMDNTRPAEVSTDVVMALAIKLLGVEDKCVSATNFPYMVHMKTQLQGWPEAMVSEDWSKNIDANITPDLRINIGRYRQSAPLHYHLKSFMTDGMISAYEKRLGI